MDNISQLVEKHSPQNAQAEESSLRLASDALGSRPPAINDRQLDQSASAVYDRIASWYNSGNGSKFDLNSTKDEFDKAMKAEKLDDLVNKINE